MKSFWLASHDPLLDPTLLRDPAQSFPQERGGRGLRRTKGGREGEEGREVGGGKGGRRKEEGAARERELGRKGVGGADGK